MSADFIQINKRSEL